MSGRYLLDTNIIIGIFKDDEKVLARLRNANSIFIPAIALGELHYGTRKSQRVEENLARIERFLAVNTVLYVDEDTAYWYGIVKEQLRKIWMLKSGNATKSPSRGLFISPQQNRDQPVRFERTSQH